MNGVKTVTNNKMNSYIHFYITSEAEIDLKLKFCNINKQVRTGKLPCQCKQLHIFVTKQFGEYTPYTKQTNP